jgi:hypothetical protein
MPSTQILFPVSAVEITAITILFQFFADIKNNPSGLFEYADKAFNQVEGLLYFLIDCDQFEKPVYYHLLDIENHIRAIRRSYIEQQYIADYPVSGVTQ